MARVLGANTRRLRRPSPAVTALRWPFAGARRTRSSKKRTPQSEVRFFKGVC